MTLNTEWLWTPHDKKVDGQKFNKGDMSAAAYRLEIDFYTDLIRQYEIDLVALSEIENESVAQDIAERLGRPWQAYFRQGRDTATGQDVALISRLPHVKGTLTDFDFPCGRLPGDTRKKCLSKVVGAAFYDPDTRREIGFITSHFLSKRKTNKKKEMNRLRQAHALVEAVARFENAYSRLIVLGDFNDHHQSPVLDVLAQQGRLMNVINACRKNGGLSVRTIDHVLFRNLMCEEVDQIDLKRFSDHMAVIATFSLP